MILRLVEDPEYRGLLADEIEEGLRKGRWRFRASISASLAWDARDEFDDKPAEITQADVDRVIEEAEASGRWPVGWVDSLIPRRPPPKADSARRAVPGEAFVTAKLTVEQVHEIRRRWAARDTAERKTTVSSLAKRFGVSRAAIHNILNGQSWGHV